MSKLVRGTLLWAALVGVAGIASAASPQGERQIADDPREVAFEAGKCGCSGGCSMQKWMKSVMAAAVASGDGAKIAKALDHVAAKAPDGYGDWATIAKAGADKARSGDIKGAKASCKACHTKYQKKFADSSARCGGW